MMTHSPTVLDIRRIVTRRPIPPGQITLYKALYEAGYRWVSLTELANTMRWGDTQSLAGVLGALGNRANQTDGYDPGFDSLIDRKEIGGDMHYMMLPELRAVINCLPALKAAIALSIDEIHARYAHEADWLVVAEQENLVRAGHVQE